jgi:hypothetical protein
LFLPSAENPEQALNPYQNLNLTRYDPFLTRRLFSSGKTTAGLNVLASSGVISA